MKTNNGNKDSTGDNVSVQLLTSVSQILHAYAEVPTFAATDVTNNDDVSDILKECDDALRIHISEEMTLEYISDISTNFEGISNDHHDDTGAFSKELVNLAEEANVHFSVVPKEGEMGIISTPYAADHSNMVSMKRPKNVGPNKRGRNKWENSNIQKDKHPLLPSNCSCKLDCKQLFTDEKREDIHNQYWSLDYNMRKLWLVKNIEQFSAKRHRKSHSLKSRTNSRFYKLMGENVCKSFFLSILGLKHDTCITTALKANSFEDKRGKHANPKKFSEELVAAITSHISQLFQIAYNGN